MFCSQCGKQIPDGSRYCNFCGAHQAVNDPNPDGPLPDQHPFSGIEDPEPGAQTPQYQDYSGQQAFNPHGFEQLPYNRHGYKADQANTQYQAYEKHMIGIHQGIMPIEEPRRKWPLIVIISASAALLVAAAILLITCGLGNKSTELTVDPRIQANLRNWGNACEIGEDYYVAVPKDGLYRAQRKHLENSELDPEMLVECFSIDGLNYDFLYLVPAQDRVYYMAVSDGQKPYHYQFRIFDTKENKDRELFSFTADQAYAVGLAGNRLYYMEDGDLLYIDTMISPEKGEACRQTTPVHLAENMGLELCPEGILMPEPNGKGFKLVSYAGYTDIRTYDSLKDQEVMCLLCKDGFLYYYLNRVVDSPIYRLDIGSGKTSEFFRPEGEHAAMVPHMNWREDDRFYVAWSVISDTEAGFHNRIYQLAGNGGQIGRDDLRTSPNDVPGYLLMSILGGKAGDYMLVRDLLNQPARFLEVYKMNDFNLEPIS